MSKRYDEPVDVTLEASPDAGAPLEFSWRGRHYVIHERLSTWREGGQWWDDRKALERDYFRVLARPSSSNPSGQIDADGFLIGPPCAVYDLYFDRLRGNWKLARLWD